MTAHKTRKTMSRRLDYFASQAMKAILTRNNAELKIKFMRKGGKLREVAIAEEAYKLALAMDAESDKHV